MFGNVKPYGLVVECVLVGIETLQGVFVTRVVAVHRGVVLVTKDDSRAGHAFSRSLATLAANRLLLIALES
jgi:hypothetical protein